MLSFTFANIRLRILPTLELDLILIGHVRIETQCGQWVTKLLSVYLIPGI